MKAATLPLESSITPVPASTAALSSKRLAAELNAIAV